jgi:hypothetical protein
MPCNHPKFCYFHSFPVFLAESAYICCDLGLLKEEYLPPMRDVINNALFFASQQNQIYFKNVVLGVQKLAKINGLEIDSIIFEKYQKSYDGIFSTISKAVKRYGFIFNKKIPIKIPVSPIIITNIYDAALFYEKVEKQLVEKPLKRFTYLLFLLKQDIKFFFKK